MMQQFLKEVDGLRRVLSSKDRIFLVTGRKSYEVSGAFVLLGPLLKAKYVERFDDFSPNPKIKDIEKGLAAYRQSNCDVIVAVGGGSVIDMAKSIYMLAPQTLTPTVVVIENKIDEPLEGSLIAIPTTAGSGSESTHFSVVYVNKQKYSLAHPDALPQAVVLDPRLVASMPSELAAISGMDAIAQAIESLWSVRSTKESRSYSRQALEKLLPNIVSAVTIGDSDSRVAMQEGANLAGRAINIAQTTAPHAVSYGMTAHYGIPHGQAVSLTLPLFIRFNAETTVGDCQDSRGLKFVRERLQELTALLNAADTDVAKATVERLIDSVGIVKKSVKFDTNLLLEALNDSRLANNPRKINREQIRELLVAVSL